MSSMQNLRVLMYQFYKPLLLWNIIFSAAGVAFIVLNGINFLLVSFSLKLAGYGSSLFYQYFFSVNQYYYYRNAGQSIRKLYAYTFLIDIILYLVIVYLYTVISPLFYA